MKLPSLQIVAAFAGGILIAGAVLTHFPAQFAARVWLALAVAWLAWSSAMAAWLCLGGAAATLERVAVPQNLASTLVDAGQLNSKEPLRWTGRLRQDPVRLPWGLRYEIGLEGVEVAGTEVPVSGGLRVNYYWEPDGADPPPTRAGDRVEALVRAKAPRNFGDPGGFDYRGHLDRQNINLE